MVDTKELRIGNWMQPNKRHKELKIAKVTNIGENDYLVGNIWGTDAYEAIPITYEILKQSGFKPRILDDKDSGMWSAEWEGCTVYYEDYVYSFANTPYSKHQIKYVHQLQNFCYALTGEELNFQPV